MHTEAVLTCVNHSDLSTVEKAVTQDAVLPCLGWTGDHMARGEHVLVRWLRALPTGEKEVLEELEVPTEPSVLAEVRVKSN